MKNAFKNLTFLSIIGGLIHCLAFAPFNSIISAFLSVCLYYFICLKSETRKQIIKNTLLFGMSYYISSLHWIVNSLLIDIGQWWFLILPTLILIPLFLSLYYLIVSIPFFYFKQQINNSTLKVVFFSGLWAVSELAKSKLFTGFPWNLLGTIWLDYPSIAQIIYYTNTIFLGFLTVFGFLTIFKLLTEKRKILPATITSIIVISLFSFKKYDDFIQTQSKKPTNKINIRIVQPNIAQRFKWGKEDLQSIIHTMNSLSFEKSKIQNFEPDLILWPETAWPFAIEINEISYDEELSQIINQLKPNQSLISGIIREDDDEIFNSAVTLKNSDNPAYDTYDKIHLVPFGEYIPLYQIIKKVFALQSIDFSNIFSNLSFGNPNKQSLKISDDLTILPLICYEGIFPYNKKSNQKFAINFTNDAWFGNSFGPYQHLRAVRSQAIKSKISVIRVANTGISAIIDERGKVIKKLDLSTRDNLDYSFEY